MDLLKTDKDFGYYKKVAEQMNSSGEHRHEVNIVILVVMFDEECKSYVRPMYCSYYVNHIVAEFTPCAILMTRIVDADGNRIDVRYENIETIIYVSDDADKMLAERKKNNDADGFKKIEEDEDIGIDEGDCAMPELCTNTRDNHMYL